MISHNEALNFSHTWTEAKPLLLVECIEVKVLLASVVHKPGVFSLDRAVGRAFSQQPPWRHRLILCFNMSQDLGSL